MKKVSTASRIKEIMTLFNLRQVDILEKVKPYCHEYNVKMNKSDLSQYVSGIVEPGQEKLAILGMALDVNEAWLMGYDVPMNKTQSSTVQIRQQLSSAELSLLRKYNSLDDKGKHTINTILEMEYTRCTKSHLGAQAAHIDDNSKEQLELLKQDIDEL